MIRNRYIGIGLAAAGLLLSSCALYHMQTPETTAIGKVNAGGSIFLIPLIEVPSLWEKGLVLGTGIWARTGLAHNFDMGLNVWPLGLRIDGKYCINKQVGLGGGLFGSCAVDGIIYGFEGSVYTGYPIDDLYPYASARITTMSFYPSEEYHGPQERCYLFTGMVGMRIIEDKKISLYGEGGIGIGRYIFANYDGILDMNVHPIFGLGIQIDLKP